MTRAPSPQQVELASRVLSRRSLLPFVQRLNERYLAGWVHEDICRRLEKFSDDVAKGLSPRLMLLMPPRSGKSELCSRSFPSWHLGRNPHHEIIACSYNVSLAMTFSKKVKEVLQDPVYHPVFDIRLDPNNQSAEEWALDRSANRTHSGGYVAAGVGGGITGKGCIIPYCTIDTSRGKIPASQLKVGDSVYGYSHETGHVVQTTVIAVSVTARVAEVVRCGAAVITVDHPVFAGGEYRPAHSTQGMPGVWLSEGADGTYVQSLLYTPERAGEGGAYVRPVQHPFHAPARGAREGGRSTRGGSPHFLLTRMLCRVQEATSCGVQHLARGMRWLREALSRERTEEILFPPLLHGVQGQKPGDGELWRGLACDQSTRVDEGQGMRVVREQEVPDGSPPYRSQPREPRPEELGATVHAVPQEISCVRGTCAEDIAGLLPTDDFVVDFQTGTGNFFAGGLLVHNCHILIIDDPLKNAEEADSADTREKLMDWYGSTAYTRLAPGGGVLIVQTWWHDSDLAGQLQTAMAADPDADQYTVVKYPAIAEEDEYLDYGTDLIVRGAPPEGPHTLLRLKGEALHPARYDLAKLNQIKRTISPRFWSALYQQNPVPDDGAYFTKDYFRRGPVPDLSRCNVFIAWDFAISEKKANDYTVGTVGLQDDDDVLHIVEVVRFKSGDGMFICEAILNLSKKWYTPGQQLGFEDGQIYRAIETLLKKRMRERSQYPSIQLLKPITDKLARARPLQGRMQQGMVSFNDRADWYDALRTEFLRFPAGVHDDMVDSVSWMAQMALGRQAPQKPKTKAPASWRDKLNLGGRGSFMAA